jgi:hypothetical protein
MVKPRKKRPHGNRRARQEALAELEAEQSSPPPRVDPVEALQDILDWKRRDMLAAQKRVEQLGEYDLWRDTMVGRIPNEWIRIRDQYMGECFNMANSMVKNGIADRAVRVQETQAALMVVMVKRAAERAGLDASQVRALGEALRDEVEDRRAGRTDDVEAKAIER